MERLEMSAAQRQSPVSARSCHMLSAILTER
jgi:hypothetical protein